MIEYKNKINERFGELIYELNKSSDLRVFNNSVDAENWILNIN